jgi:hypothetical protein
VFVGLCFLGSFELLCFTLPFIGFVQGIARYYFPRAFDHITGKKIIYMIEKKKQSPASINEVYELLCVSDDQKVIDHFLQTSKV